MRFIWNKVTLISIGFISFCLIVIGTLLQTILIPIQDFNLISREELSQLQKEYAINYPLGKGLLQLGICLMAFVIILYIIKLIRSKSKNAI